MFHKDQTLVFYYLVYYFSTICLYLLTAISSIDNIKSLQNNLALLFHWACNNNLRLNINTCFVLKKPFYSLYIIDRQYIERKLTENLGVIFDHELTFGIHMNELSKAAQSLGFIMLL